MLNSCSHFQPSFNSAVAKDEGQTRAIVNTFLSIIGSTISTFIFSMLLSKKRLNMVHIQNATLAGGVAIGAVADMVVKPYGALTIGTIAGALSVIGFEVISPALKRINLHDTCKLPFCAHHFSNPGSYAPALNKVEFTIFTVCQVFLLPSSALSSLP